MNDRVYEFGRGESAHIGEICTANEAIGSLKVSMAVRERDVENAARERWPPDFHDYAENLPEW